MKKSSFWACALWMTAALHLSTAAEPVSTTEAGREKFIAEFRRIGLNTAPGDAKLLQILVQSSRARRGVEVGSATGYGAIHMGIGFERNNGKLITIDIDPAMVRATRENLKKVGLDNTVSVVEGDALKVLALLDGEFDFVFIDALKRDYLKYLKAIEPKLKAGAVVVADNVIQSERQMRDYLDYVRTSPLYDSTTVRASMDKNDGMEISFKK